MTKIHIPKKGNTSIVMVAAPVGSFYEPNDVKGISHFVEHMCLSGDSYIDTPKGRKYIKDLKIGDEVYSVKINNNSNKHYQYNTLETSKIVNTIETYSQERYILYLEHNKKIKVTGNHPFALVTGNKELVWRDAKDLKKGDILFQRKYPNLSILANGIKIKKIKILKPSKYSNSKSFKNYNLTVEPNNNYFVDGVLVHNCFKGTKNRNHDEISSTIENIGGDLNAFTDYEITAYWARVPNKYIDMATEIITDLASNPIFPKKEVDKERQVILQELKMYEDNPQTAIYDLMFKTVYSEDSGFYIPIIGTEQSLYNIDTQKLLDFHKYYYKDNLVQIIVGDAEQKIEKYNNKLNIYKSFNLINTINEKIERRKEITQSNLIIGNHVNLSNYNFIQKVYLLKILSAVYGDMSGRLFNSIREKNNLVYTVRFMDDIYKDGSLFWGVYLGLNEEKIKKARKLVIQELKRPISNKEFEIVKEKALGTLLMSSDNVTNIASKIAYRIVKDNPINDILEDNKERYFNFSIKDINKFIKEMRFENYSVAGILPEK